jgi:hypothetical protein
MPPEGARWAIPDWDPNNNTRPEDNPQEAHSADLERQIKELKSQLMSLSSGQEPKPKTTTDMHFSYDIFENGWEIFGNIAKVTQNQITSIDFQKLSIHSWEFSHTLSDHQRAEIRMFGYTYLDKIQTKFFYERGGRIQASIAEVCKLIEDDSFPIKTLSTNYLRKLVFHGYGHPLGEKIKSKCETEMKTRNIDYEEEFNVTLEKRNSLETQLRHASRLIEEKNTELVELRERAKSTTDELNSAKSEKLKSEQIAVTKSQESELYKKALQRQARNLRFLSAALCICLIYCAYLYIR